MNLNNQLILIEKLEDKELFIKSNFNNYEEKEWLEAKYQFPITISLAKFLVHHDKMELLRHLIKKGLDFHQDNELLLRLAISNGSIKTVKYLIDGIKDDGLSASIISVKNYAPFLDILNSSKNTLELFDLFISLTDVNIFVGEETVEKDNDKMHTFLKKSELTNKDLFLKIVKEYKRKKYKYKQIEALTQGLYTEEVREIFK